MYTGKRQLLQRGLRELVQDLPCHSVVLSEKAHAPVYGGGEKGKQKNADDQMLQHSVLHCNWILLETDGIEH